MLNKKNALPSDKTLLTTKEAAYYLDISPAYLNLLRTKGCAPSFIQPAGKWGKILFPIDMLDAWVKEHTLRKK